MLSIGQKAYVHVIYYFNNTFLYTFLYTLKYTLKS